MEVNKIYKGDCLEVMKTFPDKSIDCVITSPPYWQLRDYGWTGQWGLERTFPEYLEHLWQLMDEVYRVLKDDGTVWINLGDTYSTQSGNSRGIKYDSGNPVKNVMAGQELIKGATGLASKCLLLIPHRFAIGCIDRGWIMRNDIIWAKRNCMPESVTDRFSKKHEYFFFMAKKEDYYFDLKQVKDAHLTSKKEISRQRRVNYFQGAANAIGTKGSIGGVGYSDDGKNPGSVSDFWDINTKPSKDAHFATYNTELIDKPIIAGCPKGGIILDPFCGTATTGCRVIDLQRKFIGIEGSEDYVKIGNKKLHKYLVSQQLFN